MPGGLKTEGQAHIGSGTTDTMSPDAARSKVQQLLVSRFHGKPIRIYEAGGGSLSVLPLSSMSEPTITVVDIDDVQLRNNSYADVKILGDIQTHSFDPGSFDLVVCYNVIEHLDFVDKAIRNFYYALAPGGLLFIGAPNPLSLFGIITKYSPHWFHVLVYRIVFRQKNAGKPGYLPFRTVYHPLVTPNALLEFCDEIGFKVVHFNLYLSSNYASARKTRPILARLIGATTSAIGALSFGRLDLARGDYHVVFEKLAAPATPPRTPP
jgi:2-polyprenyl-3-methyl-5-hydroxy-6-metoxy-1,4-benzoquinol methylase